MKKKLTIYSLGLIILVFGHLNIFAQKGRSFPRDKKIPELIIYESGKIENFKIEAEKRRKSGDLPLSNMEVNYNGFSVEAKAAFAEAVKLWSYLVSSEVTIKINANWVPLATGVLGSAGAGTHQIGFKNAPLDSVWYSIALANKLAGFDLEPDIVDINANFSSTINWYLGTDGNCPLNQYDFISVVMHEIGHGLGFAGSANVEGRMGSWGSNTGYPLIYDAFVFNGDNQLLIDTNLFPNQSADLKSQYTSNNIFFRSELSDAATEAGKVALYAPQTWNAGSSYSHLGDFFNGGINSMMTYSAGTGEVTHHPGPVSLAMFAEMGWVNVLFKHDKLKNIEAFNSPIKVETEFYTDSNLVEGTLLLHYSIDNFATDNSVVMETTNDTLFSAYIPVLAADTVKYYFEATTTLNRTYYHPSQGVMPVTSIDKVLYFTIGADKEPPVIVHEPQKYIFNFDKTLEISFGANDDLGLDKTFIEYKVNDGELISLESESLGYSDLEDLYLFTSFISVEELLDGDTLSYRIIAMDFAQASNTTILPDGEFFKVAILDYGTPIVSQTITFDEAGDEKLIIDNGLSIDQPDEFTSKALHSPHPYLIGDPFPTDEIEYSVMLKSPVILKESEASLRFDQIVIVEPGEGAFGGANFWDYVIVEGSVDSAKTWYNFEDGYDSRITSAFTSAYNNELNGTEGMYTSHTINLLANENLVGNDEVLIRFRLYSDQLSAGWGWAIDNLEIQPEISSVSEKEFFNAELSVYPNPSKGDFNINVSANDLIENYSVLVFNSLGKQVYYQKNVSSTNSVKHNINISTMPAGIYFVSFNYNNNTISRKIVIE